MSLPLTILASRHPSCRSLLCAGMTGPHATAGVHFFGEGTAQVVVELAPPGVLVSTGEPYDSSDSFVVIGHDHDDPLRASKKDCEEHPCYWLHCVLSVAVMSTRKPLVILTGWLGCQPRNLRRYEEFYRRQGLQVLSYIAPPSAIFECTLPYYTCQHSLTKDKHRFEMDHLVGRMLGDLQASNCSSYLFHCFSNGGCFVWEAFRQATPTPPAAIIMDSCPGFQIHRITMALDYCTWRERLQVAWKHGRYFWMAHDHASWQPHVQRRADEYSYNLRDDSWLLPQLFLYSKDDPLMPYQEVATLAVDRKERGAVVHEKLWEKSRHCAHYIDHADEYEDTVVSFIESCTQLSGTQRAKL